VKSPPNDDAKSTVIDFVRAFERGDLDRLGELLAADFVGHVTTGDGGVRDVDRAGYLESVRSMDVPTANLRVEVPNIVDVGPGRVLVMVEVHAQRGGATLHNFSGQLAEVSNGTLRELWMVDALPAESDKFWA
jgi:ketosteroid isomerase-like protein